MQKYLIFNKLIKNLNKSPFEATLKLFDILNISYECDLSTKDDINYNERFLYKNSYYDIFTDIILKAQETNTALLSLENNSHFGLLKTKEFLKSDVKIHQANDIILDKITTKAVNIEHSFDKFNAGIYYGCDEFILNQNSISSLLNITKTNEIALNNKLNCDGYNILDLDKNMAFKMAGEILFDCFDSGCDFLIVNDIRSFNLFDTYQKQIIKTLKRPLGEYGLPIFSISQILLMSLGKVDMNENFAQNHTVKPSFI